MSHIRLILAVAAVPLVLWLVVPVASNGQQLQRKIEEKRKAIETKKKRERVLTTTIEGYSRRIRVLEGDIATLRARQATLEADLGRKRAELRRSRTTCAPSAPGSSACGRGWPRRGSRWPTGWCTSIRPTSPTS